MLLERGEQFRIHHGDCIPQMMGPGFLDEGPDRKAAWMPAKSVDMAIFSPPFPSLYAYTDNEADIGNVATLDHDAKLHLGFFFRGLARVMKPGRVVICHVMQIPRMKRSGEVGLHDFRGICRAIGERAGLIYEYDWLIRKNPQAQAIRTRSRELQFVGLETDRAKQRGTLCDYLLKFRAPGENEVPIDAKNQVSRNDWIKWAEGCWDDIIETDTLNVEDGRGDKDTKHICPLQLEPIRRCVLMFSNPDEIVFSPFTGIGSEGFMAIGGTSPKTKKRVNDPRRFYGCELKDEYYRSAVRKLGSVKTTQESMPEFRFPEDDEAECEELLDVE
jgi:hypothetical protein